MTLTLKIAGLFIGPKATAKAKEQHQKQNKNTGGTDSRGYPRIEGMGF